MVRVITSNHFIIPIRALRHNNVELYKTDVHAFNVDFPYPADPRITLFPTVFQCFFQKKF